MHILLWEISICSTIFTLNPWGLKRINYCQHLLWIAVFFQLAKRSCKWVRKLMIPFMQCGEMVACWLRWVLERSLGMLGHALCRGKEKCTFDLLSLEEIALAIVRVMCSLAGGKSNAPLSCQMRIPLPHVLFSNMEYSCTRGLHSLLVDTVRALLHQPDLCFYLPWCRFSCWHSGSSFFTAQYVGSV